MAGRYDRVNGVFNKVNKRYDKVNGIWQPVKKRFVKANGMWQPSFTLGAVATDNGVCGFIDDGYYWKVEPCSLTRDASGFHASVNVHEGLGSYSYLYIDIPLGFGGVETFSKDNICLVVNQDFSITCTNGAFEILKYGSQTLCLKSDTFVNWTGRKDISNMGISGDSSDNCSKVTFPTGRGVKARVDFSCDLLYLELSLYVSNSTTVTVTIPNNALSIITNSGGRPIIFA